MGYVGLYTLSPAALSLHMGVRVLMELERSELKSWPMLMDWQSESNKLCGGMMIYQVTMEEIERWGCGAVSN